MNHPSNTTPPISDAAVEPTKPETTEAADRSDYEAPSLTKKRSVSKVTLFSGGGATAGGLTAAG